MTEIKLGIYKHFKGNSYEVIGIAHDSETLEEMVVYKALYNHEKFGRDSLWVRPVKMFLETVNRDNYSGPRFVYVGEVKK